MENFQSENFWTKHFPFFSEREKLILFVFFFVCDCVADSQSKIVLSVAKSFTNRDRSLSPLPGLGGLS